MPLWESQTYDDSEKKNRWFPEGGKKEGIDRAQRIFRVVKGDLYDISVADTCLYTFVQTHRTPKVDPNVNCRF